MDWFGWQLGGSALALGAFAFGISWWESVRFDRKWHPTKAAETDPPRDRSADVRHRPAA